MICFRIVTTAPGNSPNASTTVAPAWVYTYNSTAGSDDYAAAIAVGPDNNPVVAGASHDFYPGYTMGNLTWDYLDEAENALGLGIAKMREDSRPRMAGEAAMLFYKRGATRLLSKQTAAAEHRDRGGDGRNRERAKSSKSSR